MMKKIIIIGTLHDGFTPRQELIGVLTKCAPDQLLVEMTVKDIEKRKIVSYPIEMRQAYQWALRNKIKVAGFDSPINTLKKGVQEKDYKNPVFKQNARKLMKGLTWKDMNKAENDSILGPLINPLINQDKRKQREKEMVKNIRKAVIPRGKIVIVTGAGHLRHFEKAFPHAEFPLRPLRR